MLIGLIGAGGLVGQTVIQCINQDEIFNSDSIEFKFYTQTTNLGSMIPIFNKWIKIEKFFMSNLQELDFDFIILATENNVSYEIITFANTFKLKTKFIDLSSEFRLKDGIPLVIPEVNPEDLELKSNIISSPNCTTTFLVMVLKALESLGKILRVYVSTYQSASGAGIKGFEELKQQARDWVGNEDINNVTKTFWSKPLLFNVFSHNSAIQENLYNSEEMKIVTETTKILHQNDIKITPTCVRVPVLTSHCESINIEFDRPQQRNDIIMKLEKFPGIKIVDNCDNNTFPEPFTSSGLNDIFVGRIRPDIGDDRCWNFFVCGDQLVKGSGLNAVQILKELIKKTEKVNTNYNYNRFKNEILNLIYGDLPSYAYFIESNLENDLNDGYWHNFTDDESTQILIYFSKKYLELDFCDEKIKNEKLDPKDMIITLLLDYF